MKIKLSPKERYELRLKKLKESKDRRIKRLMEKKKLQLSKARQPSLAELKKKAQKLINSYVRIRDQKQPCISCQKYIPEGHAGHYIAQGWSGALRFNLDNIHKQCATCNVFKRGNLVEYRVNLVKLIGELRVKYLEDHRHDIKKWTREELEEIIKKYSSLTDSVNK